MRARVHILVTNRPIFGLINAHHRRYVHRPQLLKGLTLGAELSGGGGRRLRISDTGGFG